MPRRPLSPPFRRARAAAVLLKFLRNQSIKPPEPNGVPSTKTGLTVTTPSAMIQSTSLSDAAGRAKALQAVNSSASVRVPAKNDRLSTAGTNHLRAALKAYPEIRPEVVARGRTLAADPAYPSPEIIQQISAQIVRSPDLSNDPSQA
jgi:hypothetical protein